MPSKEKYRHLIHHFAPFKTVSCFGIWGCHNFCRQIIGGGSCGNLICALTCQFRNQITNAPGRSAGCTTVKPWHPAGQRNERRNIQYGLRTLIGAKFLKHFGRDVMGDWNGKQGAKNNICGGITGQFFKFLYTFADPIHRCISGCLHRRHRRTQASPPQRRDQ